MKGVEINGKHTIGSCIGVGSFGKVFKVQDTPNVIKISLETSMMANEIRSINIMASTRRSKGVTKVLDYGLVVLKNFGVDHKKSVLASFYVMPKYKCNLD